MQSTVKQKAVLAHNVSIVSKFLFLVWNLPFVSSPPSTLSSNTPPNFCSTDERKAEPKRKPDKCQLRSLFYEKKSQGIQNRVTTVIKIFKVKEGQESEGAYHSAKKIRKFRRLNYRRLNGTLIFQKILSKIIDFFQRLLSFFRPERKGGNFLTIC